METASETGRGWYYRKGNWTLGPVAVGELKQLVDAGTLPPHELVCDGKSSEWISARSVVGPPHFPLPGVASASRADSSAAAALIEERPNTPLPYRVAPQVGSLESRTRHESPGSAVAEPAVVVESPLPRRNRRRALFTVLTAIPILSAVTWTVLAVRLRKGRLALNGLTALLWPFVGLVTTAIFAVIAELGAITDHDIAILFAVWTVTWFVSLAAAQGEWKWLERTLNRAPAPASGFPAAAGAATDARADADRDSPALCYLLWLLLGWAGGHRFYCGRWMSGLLYAGTFGLGGAGWAADLLLLNQFVDESRRRRVLADLAHAGQPGFVPSVAGWSGQSVRSGPFDFVLRLGFFCTAPMVFVLLCVMLNQYQLLAVMIVVIVVCGLLGDLERARERYAALYNVPVIGSALTVFDSLHGFYLQHRPRNFVFYLFYPLTATFAASRSKSARDEVWLYWKILRPVIVVIAVQQVMTYPSIYPPHLGFEEAFIRIFVLSFFGVIMTTMFLVPMVTTSFALSLSGQQSRLKFLAILTLALALPTGAYGVYEQSTQISFLAADRLETRMDKESFRHELRDSTEMFLAFHINRIEQPIPGVASIHPELTGKYHRHVGGIALDDEVNGFAVFTLPDVPGGENPDSGGAAWLGVRVWYGMSGDPPTVLFLMDPRRRLYTTWDELSRPIQRQFRIVTDLEFDDHEHRPDFIASIGLIDDRR